MSKKYNSAEELQDYISRLEGTLKSYEDEYFNVKKSIDGCKSEINSIQLMQTQSKDNNYMMWQQLPNLDTRIEDVQRDEPTIDSILGDIL